jgi:hypothetical protein
VNPKEPLRPWLDPGLDSARIARQWGAIEGRLDRGARPRWTWGAAFLGAAVAIGALGFGLSRLHSAPHEVAVQPTVPSVLILADGSRVTLDPDAKVDLITNERAHVVASVQRGKARFDVAADPGRVFSVLAGEVEMSVAGAQFQLDFDPASSAVTVAVASGSVEIRSPAKPGEVHRVNVGETWSTARAAVDPVAPPAPPSEATAAASVDPIVPAVTAPTPARGAAAAPVEDARSLFESANQARRGGDLARASTLYRELTRRFPNDPRARVAALELGRIEMDRGRDRDRDHDPAVAEQALRQASSAEAGSSVHEDALARLVQLYAAKGDARACQVAQARYLAAYPNGVHGAQVRAACAPR